MSQLQAEEKSTVADRIANQLNTPPQTTACQKLFILLAFGIVLGLASLTAALPMTNKHHQASESIDSAPSTNSGDTAWVIVATILGFLLIPAFSFLYSNIYGRTSTLLTEVVLIIAAMITFIWIIFSFSLVYAKDANGDGIMGFPKYYYMFAHTVNFPVMDIAPTIPGGIFAVFELIFALLTPTIVATAVIDRVEIYGFLAFIFVWHLCIYTPVAHITWHPDGWFAEHEIIDFSGGIVVHMLSSITVLGAHLFLNWKGAPEQSPRPPRNTGALLLNALVVWFLWFGINAGKAHSASTVAAQSIVNTIAAVTISVFFNFLVDVIFDFDNDEVALVNAILLGLISSTPSSGYVTVGGSMIITLITIIATRTIANFFLKEGVNAPYSVVTLHGLAGSISFLFTAFISYEFINTAGIEGLTYGFQTGIRHHLAVVLAMWSCALIAVLLCLFVCDFVVSLAKIPVSEKGDYAPAPVGSKPVNTDDIDYADVHKDQTSQEIVATEA